MYVIFVHLVSSLAWDGQNSNHMLLSDLDTEVNILSYKALSTFQQDYILAECKLIGCNLIALYARFV